MLLLHLLSAASAWAHRSPELAGSALELETQRGMAKPTDEVYFNLTDLLANLTFVPNSTTPQKVILQAGVHQGNYLVPAWANLELQGQAGAKLRDLFLYHAAGTHLTLRSLELEKVKLQSCPYYLCDYQLVEANPPRADLLEVEGYELYAPLPVVSMVNSSFASAMFESSARALTVERSSLNNLTVRLSQAESILSVADSNITGSYKLAFGGIGSQLSVRHSYLGPCQGPDPCLDFDLRARSSAVLQHAQLEAVRGRAEMSRGRWDITSCSLTGPYRLTAQGEGSLNVQNSYLGPCAGACVQSQKTRNFTLALTGSVVRTALRLSESEGVRVDLRDVQASMLHSPFLSVSNEPSEELVDEGPLVDVALRNVSLRDVWNAVSIASTHWTLDMREVTVDKAMIAAISLQTLGPRGIGKVQLSDVTMHNILGAGLIMDGNITTRMDRTTCSTCNMAIAAKGANLNMTQVDMMGKADQGVGIVLESGRLQAHDVRGVDLAAALMINTSCVDMEDAFLTDNAIGVVSTNSTGSIRGLVYFNDAMAILDGQLKIEEPSVFMRLHHREFTALVLLCTLVSTVSAVQLLKLFYMEAAFACYMVLWALGCTLGPVAIVVSIQVLLVIRRMVRMQEDKDRANMEEYLSPEVKMEWVLLLNLIWAICGVMYVLFDVLRHRSSLTAVGDAKHREALLAEKDALKQRLDDPALRDKLHDLHRGLHHAVSDSKEDDAGRIFEEMRDLAAAEASRLATWFVDQRRAYEEEDDGARMEKLTQIPSQSGEVVQPPVAQHFCSSAELAVDALAASASWLRADFKRQLSEMVRGLNDISHNDLRRFDAKLVLDPSLHQLQPEPGAECGTHLGLLVAPIKSKERALAKISTDYQKDFDAGKKTEQPLARYVCDFLRATIYAADPFALAIAFHSLQERFKIVRVKNKFADTKLKDEERTNILVNLWVEGKGMKQIGEVQFLMQEYLTAKSLQHMYYDVVRAEAARELFDKPIFR
ncbi:unnamed protein product [Symbiodinium natans]|uniref:Uncharacterized protein n=1 Tax=Symbiodinium natans TaxID=878477 RepID=A0A812P915_9DINO|nr:unnamed protein product [Symbiodinium natans]